MTFRNLSLCRRLSLALVPGVVIAIPSAIGQVSGKYPIPDDCNALVAVTYCALFGGFVLVPFITSRSGVFLRASVLITMTPIVFFIVAFPVSLMASLTNNWATSNSSVLVTIAAAAFVFNLLSAILLVMVAPLRTNRKFWGFVALTGAVLGALYAVLIYNFLCIIWCNWKQDLLMGMPVFVWPLLFCSTVYFWRTQPGAETTSAC